MKKTKTNCSFCPSHSRTRSPGSGWHWRAGPDVRESRVGWPGDGQHRNSPPDTSTSPTGRKVVAGTCTCKVNGIKLEK